ncbi:MAG: PcfB family protein [Lachnospiraceae bacterium]
MQEELTQKTIALSVQTTKLTASVLQKALKKLLSAGKNKLQQPHKGKQTLRQLMKHNTGVSNIEIANDNIKLFEQTAKKYGIDFSLKKDVSVEPPRYMVFFKGRDADVLTAAFKEFSAKNLAKEKKPSLRKLLSQMRDKAKQKNQHREKVKSKDRGPEL